ncbi:MAG: TonB-dependent receptor [Candidatus Acidiferrales bacterium]
MHINVIRSSPFWKVYAVLACSLLLAVCLSGQSFYGSIVGTVTDTSGSALPGAAVSLTSSDSGFKRASTTGDDGTFSFLSLVPGTYIVTIEKPGFKSYARDSITIQVDSTVRVDVAMQVGAVEQRVEVTSTAPLMQTETASLGQVVNSETVQEMPLNGRNVLNLTSLVPGVVTQGGASGNLTSQNIFASGNYQINGGTANQNAMYLDGSPIQVSYGSLTALIPTQDAVAEFKVQTNSNDAEYGRYSGGVINLTTKSGGNDYHGSAYEFLRNKVLNANNYFSNATGTPRPPFTQNQYGVSFGGPIKKDKLFFFFNYEGFALRQGQTFLETVPTPAELNGDFSNYRDANGNVIPIYDPRTTSCGQIGNPCAPGQVPTRTQFPGNMIPSTRFDPVADYFRQDGRLFAAPNIPAGNPITNQFNFLTNASVGGNNDQINFRGDWNISEKQRMFARYTRWAFDELPQDPYQNQTYWFDLDPQKFTTNSIVWGDTYTFNPTTIFDIRVSYLRFKYFQGPPSSITGLDLTTFGFPSYMNALPPQFRTFPAFAFPDFGTGGTQVISAVNNNYVISPSLTKVWGKHTVKFGAELRRQDSNYYQVASPSGDFFFDNTFTSSNYLNPGNTGSSIADFLLGGASPGGGFTPSAILTPNITAASMRYQGYFVQDSFQVNSKLTITAGLRWEIPGVWTERHDSLSVFDPNATNILAAPTGLPLKGGFQLVSDPGHSERGLKAEKFDLFAPRIGVAYRIDPNTVVRGGFGLFYGPSDAIFQESPFQNAVNLYNNAMVTSQDNGATINNVVSNPFPPGLVFPPGRSADFQNVLLGQNFTSVSGAGGSAAIADWHAAYYLNWNVTLQHQFQGGINVEAAYAASRGVHLPINSDNGVNINQLPDADLALGNQLLQNVANPFAGLIASGPLSSPNVPAWQLLRPFPTYQNVVEAAAYVGSSDYNSLQVKVQKRFHQGGTILASYTFSKLLTNTETSTDWLEGSIFGSLQQIYQNFNNLKGERSLGLFDARQSLTVSYVYPLPFGRRQRFFADVQGVADKFVSGWSFDGIATFQEGFPLNIVATNDASHSFGGGLRPNVTPGCDKHISGATQSKLNGYFNTSCFSEPDPFTYGTESRTDGAIRSPGINNWDVALVKDTSITERFSLQFRAESFNLFNRVQFGPPGQVFTANSNSSFGIITSQVNNPRLIQFGLRLNF